MPTLHVCSLARLPDTAAATRAAHLVTLVTGNTPVERPAAIAPERHLILAMSDIVCHREGHVLPGERHVAALLDFIAGWDRAAPLLIHCWAGVSRSTAAAYIAGCALAPALCETELARRLRAASPTATPNARLVALGDAALGRKGRMVDAIAAIGRGEDCFEGAPFALDFAP